MPNSKKIRTKPERLFWSSWVLQTVLVSGAIIPLLILHLQSDLQTISLFLFYVVPGFITIILKPDNKLTQTRLQTFLLYIWILLTWLIIGAVLFSISMLYSKDEATLGGIIFLYLLVPAYIAICYIPIIYITFKYFWPSSGAKTFWFLVSFLSVLSTTYFSTIEVTLTLILVLIPLWSTYLLFLGFRK